MGSNLDVSFSCKHFTGVTQEEIESERVADGEVKREVAPEGLEDRPPGTFGRPGLWLSYRLHTD